MLEFETGPRPCTATVHGKDQYAHLHSTERKWEKYRQNNMQYYTYRNPVSIRYSDQI